MKRSASRIAPVFLVIAIFLVGGCDRNGLDESDPPEVLNAAAFEFETFEQTASKSAAGANLTAAVLRYVPVSVALGIQYLLVPGIVTELATEDEPRLVDDAWVWSAQHVTEAGTISIDLTGRPDGEWVDWSMVISGNNPYTGLVENFELYTARTTNRGAEGTWELYYGIEGVSVNVLDAAFEVNSPVEKQITFTVPLTAPQYAGYEVRYERDGNDRLFFWSQLDTGDEHTLTWNPETGVGSIQSTNYLDGARYCWDADGNDIECS